MYFLSKSVLRTLLYFSIIFWVLSSSNSLAKPAAKGESLKESDSTQTAQTSENKIDSTQVPAEKNETHTPKEKAVELIIGKVKSYEIYIMGSVAIVGLLIWIFHYYRRRRRPDKFITESR